MSAHQCWMCDDTRQFKGEPCGACLDAGRIQASTPPAEAQVVGGGFEEWFGAVWAGSDNIPVPEWRSEGWGRYVAQRQLALGAWEAALSAQPRPDEAKWITNLRVEAEKSGMNASLELTRDEVLVLTGSGLAQPRPIPAVDEEMVRRGCEALAKRWRSGVPVGPTATEDVRAVLAAALLASHPSSASAPEVHSYDPTERRESVTIRWEDGACLSYVLDHTHYTNNLPASAPVGVDAVVKQLKDRIFPNHECPAESAAVWNTALYEMQRSLAQQPAAVDEAPARMGRMVAKEWLNELCHDHQFAIPADAHSELLDALAQPQGEKQGDRP